MKNNNWLWRSIMMMTYLAVIGSFKKKVKQYKTVLISLWILDVWLLNRKRCQKGETFINMIRILLYLDLGNLKYLLIKKFNIFLLISNQILAESKLKSKIIWPKNLLLVPQLIILIKFNSLHGRKNSFQSNHSLKIIKLWVILNNLDPLFKYNKQIIIKI